MTDNTKDHLWQKFSEILLFVLVLAFVWWGYWATKRGHIDFANAMLDDNKLVLGALLGLLTKAVMSRATDNGNGKNGNGGSNGGNNGTQTNDVVPSVDPAGAGGVSTH